MGVIPLVLGIGCLIGGNFANSFISEQLDRQEIDLPTIESLDNQVANTSLDPQVADSLRPWAGEMMSKGEQARPYATYISEHIRLMAVNAGYPEVKFKGLNGEINAAKAALTEKIAADNPNMSEDEAAKQVAAETLNPLSKYDEALQI